MIAQILIGPIGVFTVLRKSSCIVVFITTAVSLGACLSVENKNEVAGQADLIALITSVVFLAGYIFLCGHFHGWNRLESNFDRWPWNSDTVSSADGIPKCPFSGQEVEMKCPTCNTLIHSSAFYEENEVLRGFAAGEGPCLWKQATEALQRTDAPAIGRMQLDETLQQRGNFLLGGVGDACIGCVVWQRCFHILQKQSATMACVGFMMAFVPWGFNKIIESYDAEALHFVTVVMSVFFSSAAFFIELHTICMCLKFMEQYSKSITFPFMPLWVKGGMVDRIIDTFSGPRCFFKLEGSSIITMNVNVKMTTATLALSFSSCRVLGRSNLKRTGCATRTQQSRVPRGQKRCLPPCAFYSGDEFDRRNPLVNYRWKTDTVPSRRRFWHTSGPHIATDALSTPHSPVKPPQDRPLAFELHWEFAHVRKAVQAANLPRTDQDPTQLGVEWELAQLRRSLPDWVEVGEKLRPFLGKDKAYVLMYHLDGRSAMYGMRHTSRRTGGTLESLVVFEGEEEVLRFGTYLESIDGVPMTPTAVDSERLLAEG
ncbi:hypothetical protein BSKO_01583 [Bryopsis sp. KO-2023]|nr:hypothetical protein BSKO_01583 [Bryopsis sp. KO-2023]